MIERMPEAKSHLTAALLASGLALGLSGVAKANTGGATTSNSSAMPARITENGPCPSAEKVKANKNISPNCRGFLMRALRHSVYDDATENLAVATYQKLAHVPIDGSLGPITARSILKGKALRVASPDPRHSKREKLLIDKSQQVAYSLNGGKVKHAFSISSGTEQPYSDVGSDGVRYTGVADTPTGNFKVNSEMSASYKAPLGLMPNAHFFTKQGHAVHSGNVSPTGRQSHGCVRVEAGTMNRYIDPELKIGSTITIIE